MQDAWRAYLELAMGLTEAPRKKAQDAVRRLVGSGGATAAQLQGLAEELLSTGAANREALTKLVRFEVDRALGAVGLATADEVAELTRRVHELERQLREAKGGPSGPVPQAPAPAPAPATEGPGPG
ncbi:phasin family protein, partial [Micromonospora sp. S4605]|uniref:phasin family protein n=1 Tax=Micromonospora sp. S4605 TaxID=1420897 RepID=UPI00406C05A9